MESLVAHASRRALRALLSLRCVCFNKLDLIPRRREAPVSKDGPQRRFVIPGTRPTGSGINPPLSFVHTQKLLQSLYFAGHNESSKPSFAWRRRVPAAMTRRQMHLI